MALKHAFLKRDPSGPEGTFGELTTEDGKFSMKTGELPWMGNQHDVSCILPGPGDQPITYICKFLFSPKHGRKVYHIMGTEGRGNVEMHVGNFCGNKALGFASDVLGCVIGGLSVGKLVLNEKPQKAVLESTKAMAAFEAYMNGEDFNLTISWK